MISRQFLARFYPDDRPDSTEFFYAWIRKHVDAGTVMLNLGAGKATGIPIRSFRGEVARVVGADPDPAVRENSELDEAHVIDEKEALPFADDTFDLVLCDNVVEHVEEPDHFMGEVHRVLKPQGSLFIRTPNRYHYVAVIARLTPLWFHRLVANRARGLAPDALDQHPTLYRLNSRRAVERISRRIGFRKLRLRLFEAHPAYLMFNTLPFLLGVAYERVVNRYEFLGGLRANILARLVK